MYMLFSQKGQKHLLKITIYELLPQKGHHC